MGPGDAVTITPDAASAPPSVTITPDAAKSRTWADSVGDFGSELWKQVNPVGAVEGLSQAVAHPIDTFKSDANARQQVYDSAEQEFKKGDYVGGASKLLYSLLPLVGPQLDAAGNNFVQGNYAKGAGASTGLGLALAAPEAIKGADLKLPTGAVPERMYQSALKPSTTMSTGDVAKVVQTGLDNKIPVSADGVTKLNGLIQNLSDSVKSEIQGASQAGATVDPTAVAKRADSLKARFANQVAPDADLAAIDATQKEFLKNNPNPIPAADAQSMKQGTYQQLKARAYGEQGSATVEAQKALARGIKEELEQQFPEIKATNAAQGALIGLDDPLERAVRRMDNHQLFGIGTPIAAGAGAAIGGAPGAAVAGIMKFVLDNPEVKSSLAIRLHQASKGVFSVPAATARVASYSDALGNAVGADTSEQ